MLHGGTNDGTGMGLISGLRKFERAIPSTLKLVVLEVWTTARKTLHVINPSGDCLRWFPMHHPEKIRTPKS